MNRSSSAVPVLALFLAVMPSVSRASDDALRFFDPKSVQSIYLEVAPENLQKLEKALPNRIIVPGSFRWNDVTAKNVGVRYKGNSSSDPNARHKRSFLISFNEFEKGQRFLGLRNVALDNAIQFGSLFSERLITDALRELGVKASRCNYAKVFLNGKFEGVFVNVERIDRSFIEFAFKETNGFLYKVDEGGPGADLRFLSDDPTAYEKAFELRNGRKSQAYISLIEFVRLINNPKATPEQLREAFDWESFVTTTAVMLFSGAFDQYTGWNPHNYYLYRRPAGGKWIYIPWDLDVGFADNAFGRVPVLEHWNAAWPAPTPERPLMERLVADTNLLHQYRQRASDILESHFKPDSLIPRLHALFDQIKAPLLDDPYPPRRITVPSDRSYEDIIASMERFIRARYTLARAQLDAPGARPAFKSINPPQHDEGPAPGPASADAPTNLAATKVTSSSVQLSWKDHATGEVAYVVQKAIGPDSNSFANAIGQGGSNITTAVDRDVQPGKTYRYRVYAILPTPQGPRGTGVSNILTVEIPR